MQELGCPLMLVCSNTSPASLGDASARRRNCTSWPSAPAAATCALATRPWPGASGSSLQQAGVGDCAEGRPPAPGADSGQLSHPVAARRPDGIADIPGDRIFFVQMADAPLLAMDVIQWARHTATSQGQGQLDVVTFFEQALLAGYTGNLSLEIFNDVFRETPNRRTALDAMRSLLFLESECKNRLMARTQAASGEARAPAATRALQRLDLAAPPPRSRWVASASSNWCGRGHGPGAGQRLRPPWALRTRAATAARRWICIARATSSSSSTPSRGRRRASALTSWAPRCAPWAWSRPDPVQAANRAAALLSARPREPAGAERVATARHHLARWGGGALCACGLHAGCQLCRPRAARAGAAGRRPHACGPHGAGVGARPARYLDAVCPVHPGPERGRKPGAGRPVWAGAQLRAQQCTAQPAHGAQCLQKPAHTHGAAGAGHGPTRAAACTISRWPRRIFLPRCRPCRPRA